MNLLIDALPEIVEIDGTEYPINTDFQTAIRVLLAFEDSELTGVEKQMIMLENLYPRKPPDTVKAIERALWFLNGGNAASDEDAGPRVYSFEKDDRFIFAAFKQTHGIDLATTQYIHWWKFLALFMDLGSETTFCQLTALRKRVKTGRASKEERAAAREMGELFDIPEVDDRTLEEREREDEFLRLVKGQA